jgi:hypothetical protein
MPVILHILEIKDILHASDKGFIVEGPYPFITVERIVFTVQELITLVNSGKLKPGSVVIFDDAGLGVNARLWKNQSSVIFGMLTQGFRYMQIILLITVPKIYFIEGSQEILFMSCLRPQMSRE